MSLPKGFRAAGLPRHDRPRPSRHGLAIFYSETPAAAAACFTTNRVKSVHIAIDQKRLGGIGIGNAQALLVNSGCANCCTGQRGVRDAEKTIAWASEALEIPRPRILIASTGVIGDYLPMKLLSKEIPMLSKHLLGEAGTHYHSFYKAAEAIKTTDTTVKISHASLRVKGREVRIWGCAKGAGMIHPHMTPSGLPMATLLAFLLTDAEIMELPLLRMLLGRATAASFNRVTVDGDTSTNDSVFILANGASGAFVTTGNYERFYEALEGVCIELAKKIAKDGEGASKFLEIRVEGARTEAAAQRMAEVVATSPLVKTAAYGEDSNWGRILAAMGRSGVTFDPAKVDISFGNLCVFRRGGPTSVSAEKAREPLKAKEVVLRIQLHAGKAQGLYWTCDFTGQYVDINARYRT